MDAISRFFSNLFRKKQPDLDLHNSEYLNHRQMEVMGGENSVTAASTPSNSKYSDADVNDLKPIEGFPGQFADGQGKGGHNPTTGNSMGTYPVYDANGKYLGENATAVIHGETLNYGYSYGSPIPKDMDLGQSIMTQEQALKSSGLAGDDLTSFDRGDPNDNKDTRNSNTTHESNKGAMIDGVATPIPQGMHSIEGVGMVMNQETALRSAGLDGITTEPTPYPQSTTNTPSDIYSSDNYLHEQELLTPNATGSSTGKVSNSQQRVDKGRQERLDPDKQMGGYGDFGRSEDPGAGIGSDPTHGGGGSYDNFAV